MKVKVVSDLHLECYETWYDPLDLGSGDVLILGGDILCARHFKKDGPYHKIYTDFLKRCVDNFEDVIYIFGNHEFYGYNYEGAFNVLSEHLPKQIHILENDFVKIKDWVFLGCTLWTDHNKENPLNMMDNANYMNDYRTIRISSNYRKLNPEDTLEFHKKSKLFLEQKLEQFSKEKIWVATHHSPSYQSIHPKYKNEPSNSAFVSDLDDLILNHPQIKYWSHGHVHNQFDYMIGECRVICNPNGYPGEFNDFNPNFEVEL